MLRRLIKYSIWAMAALIALMVGLMIAFGDFSGKHKPTGKPKPKVNCDSLFQEVRDISDGFESDASETTGPIFFYAPEIGKRFDKTELYCYTSNQGLFQFKSVYVARKPLKHITFRVTIAGKTKSYITDKTNIQFMNGAAYESASLNLKDSRLLSNWILSNKEEVVNVELLGNKGSSFKYVLSESNKEGIRKTRKLADSYKSIEASGC